MNILLHFVFCIIFFIARVNSQPVTPAEGRYIVQPGVDVSQNVLQGWTNTYVPLWQAISSSQPYAIGHYGANPPVMPTYPSYPFFPIYG